jgi:fimbrial chaperone protein
VSSFKRRALVAVSAVLWTLAPAQAVASGLQVAPVTVTLAATKSADGLTLSNSGDSVVHAQVRVYRWVQDATGEHLDATSELAVSPPMVELDPGEKQLIRVIRVGPPPPAGAVEQAFRVKIDELPLDLTGEKGLRYVLNYSLPIFVQPAGADAPPPKLSWKLARSGDHVALVAANSGGVHAQVADVKYTDASGKTVQLAPGLLGYVLPGATMQWATAIPAEALDQAGTLQAMIDGQQVSQPLSASSAP